MKVCAHINGGPFQRWHERFASVALAVEAFRVSMAELSVKTGDGEHYTLDLYPQCDDCDSAMNFHDWPMTRFQLGPRGGLQRINT